MREETARYLKRNEIFLRPIELAISSPPHFIAVIPALDEYEGCKHLILSLCAGDRKYYGDTLFLFVINNSEDAELRVKAENCKTAEYLKSISQDFANPLRISVIDLAAEGHGLPPKTAGVGLARKIGMDTALTLFAADDLPKLLICVDADCTVAENYLTEIVEEFAVCQFEAAVIEYEHPLDPADENYAAIIPYEIYLRYYTLGMRMAESPFDYHAIGSTMLCTPETYVRAGGMNRRKAAEDFYFLEALRKITSVHTIYCTRVFPSARGSWRVPFGTGQRVNRFHARTHDEYLLYPVSLFRALNAWFNFFYNTETRLPEDYIRAAEHVHPEIKHFLETQNFSSDWKKITQNAKTEKQAAKQKLGWMDAFRTLKLVHHLRDTAFLPQPMFDVLDEFFTERDIPHPHRTALIPRLAVQEEYLRALRKVINP